MVVIERDFNIRGSNFLDKKRASDESLKPTSPIYLQNLGFFPGKHGYRFQYIFSRNCPIDWIQNAS
jgi:hypothetical protein